MLSQLVLDIYEGSTPLRHIVLNEAEYIVGRDNSCQICLQDSEVSRRHFVLRLEPSAESPKSVPKVFLDDLHIGFWLCLRLVFSHWIKADDGRCLHWRGRRLRGL